MKKQEYPFKARVGATVVTVVGLHHSGAFYTTQGAGLLPLSITPIESSEPAAACVQEAAIEPEPTKAWKRQGFFKTGPLPRRVVKLKADNARLWLASALHEGPVPAREVLRRAKGDGIPLRGLHRAKKRLRITSRRQGFGRGSRCIWLKPSTAPNP